MRLAVCGPVVAVACVGLAAWFLVPWSDAMAWALSAQRGFQEEMAHAIRAIQAGEPEALSALCLATFAYGFVHALGPGHGKVLLGGAAVASGATLRRMTLLTLIASLAQALAAIFLVGSLAVVLGIGSRRLGALADDWLAPISYAAVAAIGGYLIYRGVRLWNDSGHECCGHAHGPSMREAETLSSPREAAALVLSIAVRPCTGALFLLVIALRFDLFWEAGLAVMTMGLGTASFNLLVAWSGVAARRMAVVQSHADHQLKRVSGAFHVLGGSLIAVLSLTWLMRTLA